MPFSFADKLEVLGSGCLSDPQEWEDVIGERDANSASQEVENPALALKDHIVMSAGEERGDDEIPQGSIASCSESKKLDTVGQSLGKRAQTSGELLCLVTWRRVEDLFPEYSDIPIKRVRLSSSSSSSNSNMLPMQQEGMSKVFCLLLRL